MNGYRLVVTTGEEKSHLMTWSFKTGGLQPWWVSKRQGCYRGHHTTAEVCKVVVLSFGTGSSPFSRFHTPTLKIEGSGCYKAVAVQNCVMLSHFNADLFSYLDFTFYPPSILNYFQPIIQLILH